MAGETTRDWSIGGLIDPKEIVREFEQSKIKQAKERATKDGLIAAPTDTLGLFAVPNRRELGHVHLTQINWVTGQPQYCTCPASTRFCAHYGATANFWDVAKEQEDLAHIWTGLDDQKEENNE